MPVNQDIRAEAARLKQVFLDHGAVPVEADILLPAETLLDLYGEDIRARAFVTYDPTTGETVLRPDFTVPVVQMHMDGGAEPARYSYSGKVFRRQETGSDRAREFLQVGFEVFDRSDPASTDAEVFTLFAKALGNMPFRAATGDVGILIAAVKALKTSDRRKDALLRHLWRPRRFRELLERFGGVTSPGNADHSGLAFDESIPLVGLRTRQEIETRIMALRSAATDPGISREEVELVEALLDVRETSSVQALTRIRELTDQLADMKVAVEAFSNRLAALERAGIDPDTVPFEASYGRTSMEYYDGFVFGFHAETRQDLPPVASGGRYDALTKILGGGRFIPAVGGIVRPALTAQLRDQI